MKQCSLQPREMRLLALTLIAMFGLVNYLVVIPWWNQCRGHARELEKLRNDAAYRSEVLKRVEEWKKEWSAIVKKEETRSLSVESEEMWMKHFEKLADGSGVQLIQRRSVKAEGKNTSNALRVECSMQGRFEAMVRFLHLLQTDGAGPRVNACQFSPQKPGEDNLRGQLTLTVTLVPSPDK